MLVGITGKKQHGKDTLARMIGWRTEHFADYLKELILDIWGVHSDTPKEEAFPRPIEIDAQLEILRDRTTDAIEPRGLVAHSYRQLLQYVGTEYVRSVDPNFWCDNIYVPSDDNLIVADVRFPNEAEWVREHQGLIVRVIRLNTQDTDTHASEVEGSTITADITFTIPEGRTDRLYQYAKMLRNF